MEEQHQRKAFVVRRKIRPIVSATTESENDSEETSRNETTTEAIEQPKRRGRPRKSILSAIGEETQPIPVQHADTPQAPVRRQVRGKAAKQAAAAKVVTSTLDQLNFGVVLFSKNPNAAMQPKERTMIEPPLVRYAEDHAEAFTKGGELIGPVTCVAGILMWLYRLNKEGVVKLPQTRKKGTGFSGEVVRPEGFTPIAEQPNWANEVPDQPVPTNVTPITDFAQPDANGYSELTAQFESFTRRD